MARLQTSWSCLPLLGEEIHAAWRSCPEDKAQAGRESVSPKARSLLETGEENFNESAKLRKKMLTSPARICGKGLEIRGGRSSQSLVSETSPEQFPVKKRLPVWSL